MGLRKRLRDKKVYFDTNIFIYMLERSIEYQTQINALRTAIENREFSVVTSSIVFSELLPPYVKENDQRKMQVATDFLNETSIFHTIPVSNIIAAQAGFLRGIHAMKTPDALHVATAMEQNCDIFLTNDKRIKTPNDIDLALFADL